MLIKPKSMLRIKDSRSGQSTRSDPAAAAPVDARRSVYQILWDRRRTVAVTFASIVTAAFVYLLFATPTFTAESHLYLKQSRPTVASDSQDSAPKDDSFLPTQAQIIRSAPVLQAALNDVHWSRLKTFKNVEGDPLDWLSRNSGFRVEPATKDDTLIISFDSVDPQEGADFVNAIVKSFERYQLTLDRGTSMGMLRTLESEKAAVDTEVDRCARTMLTFKTDNSALSFGDHNRQNIILDRLASLSTSLTATELARIDLETQYNQAKGILSSPANITHFAQSQQARQKGYSDQAYDELRNQLAQAQAKLAGLVTTYDASNPRVEALHQQADGLALKVLDKERAIAGANAAEYAQQLSAIKEKEQSLRVAVNQQQKQATDSNLKSAEYDTLAANLDRAQRHSELLETQMKEVRLTGPDAGTLTLTVLTPARAVATPSKPVTTSVLGTACGLGLLLGCVLALLRDYTDGRIHSVDQATTLLGLPILGMVPQISSDIPATERGLIAHRDPTGEAAEAYRNIRTALHFGATSAVKCVLVTSPTNGDGKSITASNLAVAMAQAGHRTLLVDADLRRPTQQASFGINPSRGLTTVLAGECALHDALSSTAVEGLSLLPSGPIPINPSEILSSSGFAAFVEMVGDNYDRVVIDCPPVLPLADTRSIAALADAVLLVVRIDKSDRKTSVLALQGLQSVGANIFGWVANDLTAKQQTSYTGSSTGQIGQTAPGQATTRLTPQACRASATDLSDLLKPSSHLPANRVA